MSGDEVKMVLAILGGIVVSITALIIHCIIANRFNDIAIDKGYKNSHAGDMCFWLGLVGYLYVIALPDLKARPNPQNNSSNG